MPCDNSQTHHCCLYESLCENVNSKVTVYTEGGCCFSGLLVSVSCDCIKLVTQSCSRCGPTNRITVCPIDQIVAVTFCNTGL